MTTTKTAVKVAQGAKTANDTKAPKAEVLSAKELTEGKKPVQLKDLLKVVTEKANLAGQREMLINHLDQVNSLETGNENDAFGNGEGIARIELMDKQRNRYEIKNANLMLALVIELKAQIRAKIAEIETELVK